MAIMKLGASAIILPALLVTLAARAAGPVPSTPSATAIGLDHVPVAVGDLERAIRRYRDLGFVLKPGRPHPNGIRNAHAKFPDGTEIELITAPAAKDELTARYRRHLAAGDGPAFMALHAPEFDPLARNLDAAGLSYRRGAETMAILEPGSLSYIFIGGRNRSPTDRPEHFAHPNGAESLIAVWLACDDFSDERRLFGALGIDPSTEQVLIPERIEAPVVHLREGEVVLLPGGRQTVSSRRVVGVSLRVRSLAAARRALAGQLERGIRPIEHRRGRSLFLPPEITHGIWIELRESK